MASQQPPPPPPRKKKSPPAAPTTINDLGDDLLREVFLCLPSLPSLVRASLTCRPFLRAVRSSRAFRRRFLDLHSPPLLGFFHAIGNRAVPTFVPTRPRSDLDHAAAIRGAEVFFTLLPEDDNDADPEWSMEDCRGGYVVLVNWTIRRMAVYDPLTRALDLFPVPPVEICWDMHVEFHMLASEEYHGPFRIVSVCHESWGAQAAVLSSDTKEWQIFPFSEEASPQVGEEDESLPGGGTLVNGFVYWTFARGVNIRVLNTTTLQFSQIEPPHHMEGQGKFKPTKDGKLWLVCTVEHTLVVWVRRPDSNGVNRWMLDKTFPLQAATDNITRCLKPLQNSCFSVRSAYYREWNHQFGAMQVRADGQSTASDNPVWELMWKLHFPSKVKIFLWKALHGIIPGVGVLAQRHVGTSGQCPVCLRGCEDIRHLMFTCTRAKEVWKALGLDEMIDTAVESDRSGSVILEEILRKEKTRTVVAGQYNLKETIAVGAWYIWWQRREFVKGEKIAPAVSTAFAIRALTANYVQAASKPPPKVSQWEKPPYGSYKLNVDASFFPNGSGAAAAILGNQQGQAVADSACTLEHILNSATAEAIAIQKGLELVESLGCRKCHCGIRFSRSDPGLLWPN